jgi:hypothetical protein
METDNLNVDQKDDKDSFFKQSSGSLVIMQKQVLTMYQIMLLLIFVVEGVVS